jgi:hypothetical protein
MCRPPSRRPGCDSLPGLRAEPVRFRRPAVPLRRLCACGPPTWRNWQRTCLVNRGLGVRVPPSARRLCRSQACKCKFGPGSGLVFAKTCVSKALAKWAFGRAFSGVLVLSRRSWTDLDWSSFHSQTGGHQLCPTTPGPENRSPARPTRLHPVRRGPPFAGPVLARASPAQSFALGQP